MPEFTLYDWCEIFNRKPLREDEIMSLNPDTAVVFGFMAYEPADRLSPTEIRAIQSSICLYRSFSYAQAMYWTADLAVSGWIDSSRVSDALCDLYLLYDVPSCPEDPVSLGDCDFDILVDWLHYHGYIGEHPYRSWYESQEFCDPGPDYGGPEVWDDDYYMDYR